MTSTIDNAPTRNNRGTEEEIRAKTTTVTGSLLQKPVTLAAANLSSCDKNPGKADTTMDTGAIFRTQEAAYKVGSIRGETERKAVGLPIRAAPGRPRGTFEKIEKCKKN
jgi:hypothetical protein